MKFVVHILTGIWMTGTVGSVYADHSSSETSNPSESYRAYATVISVDPIVTRRIATEPESRCTWVRQEQPRYFRDARGHWQHTYSHNDDVRHYERPRRSAVPSIIGGLIGSLVGHQFGGGHGKTALTIAGAIAGASIGNRVAHGSNRVAHGSNRVAHGSNRVAHGSDLTNDHARVQRCHTTNQSRIVNDITGYDVTYRYNGETFTKRMDTHPGERVRINVRITTYNGR